VLQAQTRTIKVACIGSGRRDRQCRQCGGNRHAITLELGGHVGARLRMGQTRGIDLRSGDGKGLLQLAQAGIPRLDFLCQLGDLTSFRAESLAIHLLHRMEAIANLETLVN
jgi:hypothetical protein